MLVSAAQWSESAICIHISPYLLPVVYPSHTPYPTPLGGHKHRADLPVLCGCFPLAIYFTFGSVHISPCHSVTSSQLTLDHMVFILQFINMVYHIDWFLLNNPCIPQINPTWSWYMILLMCWRILFASVWLRIFASIFISDIGLLFSYFVVPLSGFGIRVMVAL